MPLPFLPHLLGLALASLAFALVWLTGVLGQVTADHVAWRALAAAAIFWIVGRIAGRIVLNALSDAIGERFHPPRDAKKPDVEGDAS